MPLLKLISQKSLLLPKCQERHLAGGFNDFVIYSGFQDVYSFRANSVLETGGMPKSASQTPFGHIVSLGIQGLTCVREVWEVKIEQLAAGVRREQVIILNWAVTLTNGQ